ncbi:MAG: hypothetical protein JSV36_01605, partial [Anaerolineae bacterium]
FKPQNMSAERLCENTRQAQRDFYSYRSIMKRVSSHGYWDYWLAANLIYRHTVVASHSYA